MTSHPHDGIPAADHSTRDDLGRLTSVTWRSAPGAATARGQWLVAIDGSEGSLRAARMAVRLSAVDPTLGIDLVHVQPWLVKEAAETELPRRGWQALAAARESVERGGLAWRAHVRMGDAAEAIVALARQLGSAGIAIGSRGLSAAESLLLGSVAQKVAHIGTVPVLIVR